MPKIGDLYKTSQNPYIFELISIEKTQICQKGELKGWTQTKYSLSEFSNKTFKLGLVIYSLRGFRKLNQQQINELKAELL